MIGFLPFAPRLSPTLLVLAACLLLPSGGAASDIAETPDSNMVSVPAGHPVEDSDPTGVSSRNPPLRPTKWIVIPAVFVLPETGTGLAVKTRARNIGNVPGHLDATLVATMKRQADLALEWLRDSIGGKWRSRTIAEVGRFPSLWYGRGNPPPDSLEAVYRPLYLQAQSRWARYLPYGLAAEGALSLDLESIGDDRKGAFAHQPAVARSGGVYWLVGAVLEHEGRDFPDNPAKGAFSRLRLQTSMPGSESIWHLVQLDGSQAFSWGRLTSITRIRAVSAWGDVPFWETPYLGFREALRGLPDRRLRGDAVQCLGEELRWNFPKLLVAPWQVAGFLEGGRAGTHSEVWAADPYLAGGGGVRVLLDEGHAVLRIDYGVSADGSGLYLDFGQAF